MSREINYATPRNVGPNKGKLIETGGTFQKLKEFLGNRMQDSRQHICTQLNDVLLPTFDPTSQHLRSVVLHGITGIGKTQLAWEYVKTQGLSNFDVVFWLEFQHVLTVDEIICRMYNGIQYVRDPGNGFSSVVGDPLSSRRNTRIMEWLRNPNKKWIHPSASEEEHCTWLIVLNNVDRWDTLSHWIRELGNPNGSVIITSRDKHWDIPNILKIEVPPLTPDEGSRLLSPECQDCDERSAYECTHARDVDIGECFSKFLDGNPWFLQEMKTAGDWSQKRDLHRLINHINDNADIGKEIALCQSEMSKVYKLGLKSLSQISDNGWSILMRIFHLFKYGVRTTRFPGQIFYDEDRGSGHLRGHEVTISGHRNDNSARYTGIGSSAKSAPVTGAPKSQTQNKSANSDAHVTSKSESSRIRFGFKIKSRSHKNQDEAKACIDVTSVGATDATRSQANSGLDEASVLKKTLQEKTAYRWVRAMSKVHFEQGKNSLEQHSVAKVTKSSSGEEVLEVSMLVQRAVHFYEWKKSQRQ